MKKRNRNGNKNLSINTSEISPLSNNSLNSFIDEDYIDNEEQYSEKKIIKRDDLIEPLELPEKYEEEDANNKLLELKEYIMDKYIGLDDIIKLDINMNQKIELIKQYNTVCLFMEEENKNEYIDSVIRLHNSYKECSQMINDGLNNTINYNDPIKEFMEMLRKNISMDKSIKEQLYGKILSLQSCKSEEDAYKLKDYLYFVLNMEFKSITKPLEKTKDISNYIKKIRRKLDDELYGMNECKDEILRQIINIKLGNKTQILALAGAPGVGKTKILKTLSECLEMPLKFIQCGCITDQSYLNGHSIAYIGAHPGIIAKSINESKTCKMMMILDELDKISDNNQSIINNLIHILDVEQNKEFIDNYIGTQLKLDLSEIFFSCTLNDISKVSPILINRLKIITLNGYSFDEKKMIVKNYILPKIKIGTIYKSLNISIDDNTLEYFINNKVVKEEGIRNLERSCKELLDRLQYKQIMDKNFKFNGKILREHVM